MSRNRFCLLDGKICDKSPDNIFNLHVFDSMLHIIIFQASVLSFLIWVAEVFPKNSLLSTILFSKFCAVLSFRSFANLKLAFSLQKHLGSQEKQYPFLKIFISSIGKLFWLGTNLSNNLMMSYVWREFSSVRQKLMKEDLGVSNAQAWGCPHAPPINIQGDSRV